MGAAREVLLQGIGTDEGVHNRNRPIHLEKPEMIIRFQEFHLGYILGLVIRVHCRIVLLHKLKEEIAVSYSIVPHLPWVHIVPVD